MNTPATAGEWDAWIADLEARLRHGFAELARQLDAHAAELEFSTAVGAWSTLEIAEHVARSNHFLLILVAKLAERSAARAARASADEALPPLPRVEQLEHLAAREFRWESPPHMRPERTRAPAALQRELERQCARCIALLRTPPPGRGTLHTIRMSVVSADARLDLYQYVAVLALHLERHLRQVERNGQAWRAAHA